MDVFSNTPKVGVYAFPQIMWIKEHCVTGLKRGKPQQKRVVWLAKYSDGSLVEMLVLNSRVLRNSGVDLVGYPLYCPICQDLKCHDFYHYDGKIKCRSCGNIEGENDNRPFAKIIQFVKKDEAPDAE